MSDANTPIYLCRLLLDPNCRQVRSELAHPYEMHRTIMHAFDRYHVGKDEKKREKFNILFRQMKTISMGVLSFMSNLQLNRIGSFLVRRTGICWGTQISQILHVKMLRRHIKIFARVRSLSFSLRANPTKCIFKPKRGDDFLKGKRVALLHEEEQLAWLIRKGQERETGCPGGFEILTKQITQENGDAGQIVLVHAAPEGKQIGLKRDEKRDYRMTHLSVRYNGLLRITNVDAFRNTIVRGLGSGKAFGFGLLSVRKIAPKPSAASCS